MQHSSSATASGPPKYLEKGRLENLPQDEIKQKYYLSGTPEFSYGDDIPGESLVIDYEENDSEWMLSPHAQSDSEAEQPSPYVVNKRSIERRSSIFKNDMDILEPQKWIQSLDKTEKTIFQRSSLWANVRSHWPTIAETLEFDELSRRPTLEKHICPAECLRHIWFQVVNCPGTEALWDTPTKIDRELSLPGPLPTALSYLLHEAVRLLNVSLSMMIRVCVNIEYLQTVQVCEDGISLFVHDREGIASLLFLSLSEVSILTSRLFHQINEFASYPTLQRVKSWASDQSKLAVGIGQLFEFDTLDRLESQGSFQEISSFWFQVAWSLDVATISYCGAHLVSAKDHSSLLQKVGLGPLYLPQREDICFEAVSLKCMGDLVKNEEIWVLGRPSHRISQSVSLSVSIIHLADTWGPVWKLKDRSMEEHNQCRFYYAIGTGAIGRAPPSLKTENLIDGEILCHFVPTISQMETALLPFSVETSRLLIGSSFKGLENNASCNLPQLQGLSDIDLRAPGTSSDTRRKTSSTYNVSVSYSGVQVGYSRQYKLRHGTTLKERILMRWAIEPEKRDFNVLALRCGLEVSICTRNAVRHSLWNILASSTMVSYLKRIYSTWEYPECAEKVLQALGKSDFLLLSVLYEENQIWRRDIGLAIAFLLDSLSGTGLNQAGDLDAFAHVDFYSSNPGKIASFLLKQYTWAGFLRVSAYSATFAIATSRCLPFLHARLPGQKCRKSKVDRPQYSVLETSIIPIASPGLSLESRLSKTWAGLPVGRRLPLESSTSPECLKVIEHLPNRQLIVRWSDSDFLSLAAARVRGVRTQQRFRESIESDEYESITGARVYIISKKRNNLPSSLPELLDTSSNTTSDEASHSLSHDQHWYVQLVVYTSLC